MISASETNMSATMIQPANQTILRVSQTLLSVFIPRPVRPEGSARRQLYTPRSGAQRFQGIRSPRNEPPGGTSGASPPPPCPAHRYRRFLGGWIYPRGGVAMQSEL